MTQKIFCEKCGKEIKGEFIQTLGKDFCNEECYIKWVEELE
jgi:hypothetical protein